MKDDPLAGLEEVPWRRLGTSGGEQATGLPKILRQLAEIRDPEAWLEAYGELPARAYLTHSHGPYVSEAAAPAVPFVVALLPLVPGPLPPPYPSGLHCMEVLFLELVSICNGVVPSRQEHLEQARRWGDGNARVPSEEDIAREHQILQRARTAVRRELERLLVYLDHPTPAVRSAVYALVQALPEERVRVEPLLREKLADEQDAVARSELLLALDGKVTCPGVPSQIGCIPVAERMHLWKTESAREVRLVLAYSLVMQLRDEAPSDCMGQLARAMGKIPVLPSEQRSRAGLSSEQIFFLAAEQGRQQSLLLYSNDAQVLAREAYLSLRSSVALEALWEALSEGYFRDSPEPVLLLLHALSGNSTLSPSWEELRTQPRSSDAHGEPLRPFPEGQLDALSARVLACLLSSEWFWPWGGEMLAVYGLPSTRDGLLLRLG